MKPFDFTPERLAFLLKEAETNKLDLQVHRAALVTVSPQLEQRFQDSFERLDDIIFKLQIMYGSIRSNE